MFNFKKIILTCNYSPWSYYRGGGQFSTHYLATYFSNLGIETVVIFTKAHYDDIQEPEDLNYRVRWATFPGIKSGRKAVCRNLSSTTVCKIVEDEITEKTIVHCNGEEGALLGFSPLRDRFKLIVTPRYPFYSGVVPLPTSVLPSPFALFRFNRMQLLALLLFNADLLSVTSEATKLSIQKYFCLQTDHITVIPTGIAPIFLKKNHVSKANEKKYRIVFYGRLETPKGIDVLLEAFLKIPVKYTLHIVGNGSYLGSVERFVARHNLSSRISIQKWTAQRELLTLIRNSKVVCLPSREESFGNAIAETMAAGVLLISADIPAIKELIRHG